MTKNFWRKFCFLVSCMLLIGNACAPFGSSPADPVDPSLDLSPGLPNPNPNLGSEPEGEIPVPDTILQVNSIIDAEGTKSLDKQWIQIQGKIIRVSDNQPISSKVLVWKKSDPNIKVEVFSNGLGLFNAQLPADPQKPVEFVQMVTLEDEAETSEVVEVKITDISGLWHLQVQLNQGTISPSCEEQIEGFNQLDQATINPVLLQEDQAPYLLLFHHQLPVIDGVKHLLDFTGEKNVQARGEYALNPESGFQYDPGCYESIQYELSGDLQHFEYTPEGRYVDFSGNFSAQLSGVGCSQTCELAGQWTARSFATWLELEHGDEWLNSDSNAVPVSQAHQLKKKLLTSFPVASESSGSFRSLIALGEQTLIALNDRQLFRINISDPDNILVEKLFALPQPVIPPNLEQIVTCPPGPEKLQQVHVLEESWLVVSFQRPCPSGSGFYLVSSQEFTPYGQATQVLLPDGYPEIASSLIWEGRLWLLGTQFPFSLENLWYQTAPNQVYAKLFEYRFENDLHHPVVKTHELTDLQNPKDLWAFQDQLWVFDHAIQNLWSFNQEGGLIQVWSWQGDELKADFNLIPYFPWRFGSAVNFRNLTGQVGLALQDDEPLLFLAGVDYLSHIDLSQNISEQLPDLFSELPNSLHNQTHELKWIKTQQRHDFPLKNFSKVFIHQHQIWLSLGQPLEARLEVFDIEKHMDGTISLKGPKLRREYLPTEYPHSIFKAGNHFYMLHQDVFDHPMPEAYLYEIDLEPVLVSLPIKI